MFPSLPLSIPSYLSTRAFPTTYKILQLCAFSLLPHSPFLAQQPGGVTFVSHHLTNFHLSQRGKGKTYKMANKAQPSFLSTHLFPFRLTSFQ